MNESLEGLTAILVLFSILVTAATIIITFILIGVAEWKKLTYLLLAYQLVVALWIYVGLNRQETTELYPATVKTYAVDIGKMQVIGWVENGKFKTKQIEVFVDENHNFAMRKTSVNYGLRLFPSVEYKFQRGE